MAREEPLTVDSFVQVRKVPTPERYPVGHQGHHLPNDIELAFESGVVRISRPDAERLLHELHRLLR